MRVEDFLRQNAQRFPDKTALVAGAARLTYAQFDAQSDRLAAHLQQLGVKRNDRVLVFMENTAEAAVAIYAVLKAGATFSPINPSTKADKLAYIVGNCRPVAILTQTRLCAVAREAIADRDIALLGVGTPKWDAALGEPADIAPHHGIDIDLAMLVYTSGSTGRPKGVMMTHRNVDAASHSITTYLENTADDVILCVSPLAFDYGLYQLIMAVRMGATLVLERSFAFPAAIFETMRRERVTGLPLVPTMAAMILQMKGVNLDLPDLRYITNTAAALPVEHILRLRATFPGATLFSMYGLTECKRCTYLPPAQLDRRPDSVGVAIPNTEAYVADDDGEPVANGVIVSEVVVVGIPDPVLGKAIKALVVRSDPALTDSDILRACHKALEDFMVPRSVEFRDSLPKTDTGKVSRRLAAESLELT